MRALTQTVGATLLAALALVLGCAPAGEGRPPAEPREGSADARSPGRAGAGEVASPGTRPSSGDRAAGEPDQVGLASWYGRAFAGRRTASGERFDPRLFTAAHKKLPFGTWVEVRSVDTGRTVRVRINDRGPNGHAAHRIIDLSQRAAEALDIVRAGVAKVELRIVGGP